MKKHVTKIICASVATVVAASVGLAAGCSQYNKGTSVNYTPSNAAVHSNGGFAVEKDNYIYFINGPESYLSNNEYGTPVKGSIMRIATSDLDNGNYNAAETLVPQIAYSTNYQTGIFVYGDYIYYGTPSTKRNADGAIQNTDLEMKRTKLDGSESMKEAYVTFPSAAYDYRFVEVDGTVYLMYVATSETLYEESTGVTNLHSYNTKTGVDTLLAYNIENYIFDAEEKSNSRVYYTMKVYDYSGTSNTASTYNQIYTVTADKAEQNSYKFEDVFGWDEDSDHYVNCGDLVFDGIGGPTAEDNATIFNADPTGKEVNELAYSYTLKAYTNNTLFYTRSYTLTGNTSSAYLFSLKDSALATTDPISGNLGDDTALLKDGSNSANYKYIFNGDELKAVLTTENSGSIAINNVVDGKLAEKINNETYYRIAAASSATMLFVDEYKENEPAYLYYSVSGNTNGYSFNRIAYNGNGYWENYADSIKNEDKVTEYTSVRVLDLDAANDWYKPELIGGYLLFAGESNDMSVYNYIMAFNIGAYKTNEELDALNELYNGIIGSDGIIAGYGDSEKYPTDLYANLANAARYMFYTADIDYVVELAKALNAEVEDGDDLIYSENTLDKLRAFLAPAEDNDWADYTDYKTINGEKVFANRRNYYYSVIGQMTEEDAENYANDFKTSYLRSWPEKEEELSWYQGLSTTARVFFIIGMCLAGLLVLAGIVVAVIFIIRKTRSNNLPTYAKRRIKVDTTDDKNINVYEDESEKIKE